MAKKSKSKMTPAAILNFGKSGILGYSDPDMVSLYQHTKFKVNIFISLNDRDMANNPKSKMAAAAVLNFGKKCNFWYK